MFQICDIVCYFEVMRLESAEVGEKSPKNLKVYTSQNVGDTDSAPSELRYKIMPHSDILAKVAWDGILRLHESSTC